MDIDLVITWVDGQDPAWLKKRNLELAKIKPLIGTLYNQDSTTSCRWRDRNEIFYVIRTVEVFMPFVRNIFLVTDNQVPSWYTSEQYPKIKLISHEEIFPDHSHLPTFNSNAIEGHLHRIKGLSEYFIYMNDDWFIGKEIGLQEFFTSDFTMKVLLAQKITIVGEPNPRGKSWASAWKNTNRMLDQTFVKEKRQLIAHVPTIFTKSVCEMVWKDFSEELNLTSSRKFRSIDTCLTTGGLYSYYAIYMGNALPVQTDHRTYFAMQFEDTLEENQTKFDLIKEIQPKFISIQDVTSIDTPELSQQLHSFLESLT